MIIHGIVYNKNRDGSRQVGCAGGKGNGAAGGDVVLAGCDHSDTAAAGAEHSPSASAQ